MTNSRVPATRPVRPLSGKSSSPRGIRRSVRRHEPQHEDSRPRRRAVDTGGGQAGGGGKYRTARYWGAQQPPPLSTASPLILVVFDASIGERALGFPPAFSFK